MLVLLAVQCWNSNNPYYQHLPNCKLKNKITIKKNSISTGLICPMVRDERGFLSEFVAYYQMHGFSHVLIFDHNSREGELNEIEPWIQSGFVSIISNFTIESLGGYKYKKEASYDYNMRLKLLTEIKCKEYAVEKGYTYFFSGDLDEYIVPTHREMSIIDEFDYFFEQTNRKIISIEKKNFVASPHILEPVDLLTIEAYQVHSMYYIHIIVFIFNLSLYL
jgi:hypothetical protein